MGEQAFTSVVSQPISAVRAINYNADYKKQAALENSKATTQRLFESVEAYHERMNQFQLERKKRIEADNTATAEKLFKEAQSLALSAGNDPSKLAKCDDILASLFRFNSFNKLNKNFDDGLYLAKKQERVVENKLYKIKQGSDDGSRESSNPMLYDGTFQGQGQRNFLC